MPTTEKLRERLIKKLKELFQLDKPDLDFGFYKIMHAKGQRVSDFIENDLLKTVESAFSAQSDSEKEKAKTEYEQELQTAREYGAADPENAPKVIEAKARYEACTDTSATESDIYDHLYRFFERYYDDGDFLSRRYYIRETPGKAAPFAIPYNGEEIKLHWANSDQYYIKTDEYFTNYTFDLLKAAEISKQYGALGEMVKSEEPEKTLKVHFKIVDATEGEHGNIKADNKQKRYFLISKEHTLDFNESGELTVYFEYRPDPEKTGQDGTWHDKRNAEAVTTIMDTLKELNTQYTVATAKGETPLPNIPPTVSDYLTNLSVLAPTEKDKTRPLLAKYINRYTSRNTMDYFIHKDLGSFLRRELDFYIKNEVMHLDDIENADVPAVQTYFEKIKVLRQIAGKLIDFLAQLEDFQKKLWLKKKFVVETNYCITLDRVPEELYPQITANEAQHDEWVKLFAINEIAKDTKYPGYTKPLNVGFLKANNKLVLDTRFFDESFKSKLLASIEDFDEQCDGLLIHSENFQALNLLQERYREQVKCVYIDPPYNTDASKIIYKNGYEHSSWVSLMESRLLLAKKLMFEKSIISVAIDDFEFRYMNMLMDEVFGIKNAISNIAIFTNPKGRDQDFIAQAHDYTIIYSKIREMAETNNFILNEEEMTKKYSKNKGDLAFRELPLKRTGTGKFREDRPYMFFPFLYNQRNKELFVLPEDEYIQIYNPHTNSFNDKYINEIKEKYEKKGFIFILPISKKGAFLRWRWGYKSCASGIESGVLFAKKTNTQFTVYQYSFGNKEVKPKSMWIGEKYDASSKGTNLLEHMLPNNLFTYPKSLYTVEDNIIIGSGHGEIVLDYFAGSATTSHAVINLNRRDEGVRKYILIEMGNYFDTVLKPRIAKVIYSESWKDGKPTARQSGVSHCFKYLRLESYEDTLNNLRLDNNTNESKKRIDFIEETATLKEDYMLHYLLDAETKGSQSLLNIDAFTDPTAYTLTVKKPGSDESVESNIDLIETFNYLIGLRIEHIAEPQSFTADFKRVIDPDSGDGEETKLILDGKFKQLKESSKRAADGKASWWFRKIEGWVPQNSSTPDDGLREKVLIVWRKLSGDIEKDNLMLDEWFTKNRISTRDFEFDTIYVNGSNNLPNLQQEGDSWKVRLIEEEFRKRMWDVEGI